MRMAGFKFLRKFFIRFSMKVVLYKQGSPAVWQTGYLFDQEATQFPLAVGRETLDHGTLGHGLFVFAARTPGAAMIDSDTVCYAPQPGA